MIHSLPLEIIQHIYSYDPTYLDYFRVNVIPELMDKVWTRIFCRIEGMSHKFVGLDHMTYLSIWYFTQNDDEWSQVSSIEEEDFSDNE